MTVTNPEDLRVHTHPVRNFPRFALRALTGSTPKPPRAVPIHPYEPNTWARRVRRGVRCTWVNHATVLIEIDGFRLLTDPMFSRTPSPVAPFGPRRWHPPGLTLAQLPEVDAVLLSHDHHDHLDRRSLKSLARRGVAFYAPRGIATTLAKWGITSCEEVEWWDTVRLEREGATLTLTAAPARHLSGRHLALSRLALWCSWALHSPARGDAPHPLGDLLHGASPMGRADRAGATHRARPRRRAAHADPRRADHAGCRTRGAVVVEVKSRASTPGGSSAKPGGDPSHPLPPRTS